MIEPNADKPYSNRMVMPRDLETEGRLPVEAEPTFELFATWMEQDSKMTEDDIEAEMMSWENFKDNINAERDRAGARRVF